MSKNRLIETLDRLGKKQTPSVGDAVAMLMGKSKQKIPRSVPKYTSKIKSRRDAVNDVVPEEVETLEKIEHIPEIDHIPEIPDGFPNGTILNDDGTLTLPDGRMIRKKQEVDHG